MMGIYSLRIIDLTLFHVHGLVVGLGWNQLFGYLLGPTSCTIDLTDLY